VFSPRSPTIGAHEGHGCTPKPTNRTCSTTYRSEPARSGVQAAYEKVQFISPGGAPFAGFSAKPQETLTIRWNHPGRIGLYIAYNPKPGKPARAAVLRNRSVMPELLEIVHVPQSCTS
jgi:hypothetical protein